MNTVELGMLSNFEEWLNSELLLSSLTDFDVAYYMNEVKFSARRQFSNIEKQRNYVGASALSIPDVLMGLLYLGYPHVSKPYPIKTALTFHLGDLFEALIVTLMNTYGLKVTNEQLEIQIHNTPVIGHIDGMVEKLDALVEIKTMAASYFKSFVKEPNNYRGYITQLAIYKYTTGRSNAFWVCFNKETSEVKCVVPDEEVLYEAWVAAQGRAEILNGITGIKSVANFGVPDPKPEVFKKEETGKLMLPMSMRYTPYVSAFYDIYEGTDGYKHKKTYVKRVVNDPAEKIERINNIKQELCNKYGRTN